MLKLTGLVPCRSYCSWNTYHPWLQLFGRMIITCSLRQQLSFGSCFQLVRYCSLFSLLIVKGPLVDSFYVLPERSPPIEEVIQAGVVPRFVEFLMREDFPQLQVIICLLLFWAMQTIFTSAYIPLTLISVWCSLRQLGL